MNALTAKTPLKGISEIARDIGQVFFGSVFVAAILGDQIKWGVVGIGLFLCIVFWAMSIYLLKYE